MKALNFLTIPSILLSPPTTTTLPYTNLNIKPKNSPLFITHCSNNNDHPQHKNPNFESGLVFDLGLNDSWDNAEIGSPVVKRFLSDDEERWYLWYYGKSKILLNPPNSDSVGLAVSSNGIHWERGKSLVESNVDVGLVMKCSEDWWVFDKNDVRPSEVVIMSSDKVRVSSSVYWLYYTGYFDTENVDFGNDCMEFDIQNPERVSQFGTSRNVLKSLPGLAISQDGRHWARIEGEHHTGALFDVGSDRDWDSTFIASPSVVFHGNGDLRMYYHSFDVEKRKFGIGIARSRDGINWVKLGKIIEGGGNGKFDEFGAKNPCVVKNKKDGTYVMAYEGLGAGGARSIGIAMSPDGLGEWKRLVDVAVLKASSDDGWDNREVGCPYLVQVGDDEVRLYYRGVGNGGRTGIGVAISQGNDYKSFRRWSGFSLT
ncbi:hypothetical protein ACFE04_022927 [Oxalis oulophora]